jgi:hypothetical protein
LMVRLEHFFSALLDAPDRGFSQSWINRNGGGGVGGDSRWAHILVNVGKVLARLRVGILVISVRVCVQTHNHEAPTVYNTKRRKRNRKAM